VEDENTRLKRLPSEFAFSCHPRRELAARASSPRQLRRYHRPSGKSNCSGELVVDAEAPLYNPSAARLSRTRLCPTADDEHGVGLELVSEGSHRQSDLFSQSGAPGAAFLHALGASGIDARMGTPDDLLRVRLDKLGRKVMGNA
jgi:hypothetical protein